MYRIIKRIIIITMLISVSLVIIGNLMISNRAWNFMLDEFILTTTTQVEHFFSEESSDLQVTIERHAVWTDTITHLNANDEDWLYDNATGYLVDTDQFRIDYLFISNEAQTIQKSYGLSLNDSSLSQNEVQLVLNENESLRTIHWFNDQLLLVQSTPLYDNSYENPEGMYTIGRVINKNVLQSLQKYLGNNNVINISISKTPAFNPVTTSHFKNINLSVPISYGNDIFYTNLSFSFPIYQYFFVTSQSHLKAILIAFALFVIVIALIAMKKISNHLNDTISIINRVATGSFNEKLKIKKYTLLPEINDISSAINTMSDEIEDKIAQIDNKYVQMISLIVNAVEVNDAYTYRHSQMVSLYAVNIAKLIDCKNIKHVEIAGQFHDIGKISIPKSILNKPGKLNYDEYTIIKQHPAAGYKIIKDSDFHEDIKQGVLYHHERYDGMGYPEGLKGDEIPLIAQILSIADVYDALTSNRPYRGAMTQNEAISILIDGKNTAFNPELVDVFIAFIQSNYSTNNCIV